MVEPDIPAEHGWDRREAGGAQRFRSATSLLIPNGLLIYSGIPAWITKEITYGLYLSDHSILNDVETELVVLSGIMIQNLRSETHWHLRGTRRVGASREDVEKVQRCVSFSDP